MTKKYLVAGSLILIVGITIINTISCNSIARAAAKYWTNRQIREFVNKCEDKSSILLGSERAKKYCDCAVDVVAEKYQHYDDIKNISVLEVLKVANNCK